VSHNLNIFTTKLHFALSALSWRCLIILNSPESTGTLKGKKILYLLNVFYHNSI
jgi:hypothetical protein